MAQKDDFNFFFIPVTISIFQVQIPRVLLGSGLDVKSPSIFNRLRLTIGS